MNAVTRSVLCVSGLALFSTMVLAGCGSEADQELFPEPIAETLSAEEAPRSVSRAAALTTAQVDTLRSQILAEINKARAVPRRCGTRSFAAAPPLKRDTRVDTAAQSHSVDMAAKNYFSHTGLDGKSPFDRIEDAGYSFSTAAENIAAGNATAAGTVQQWLGSAGHCANLMSPSFIHTGIGYGYNEKSTYKHYWTQVFGKPL